MSNAKPRRSFKHDATTLPFELRSKNGDCALKGTPLVQLSDNQLYRLTKLDPQKDHYNLAGQSKEILQDRAKKGKTLQAVNQTIDILAYRQNLKRMVGN